MDQGVSLSTMQIKDLFTDDDAASPLIGSILMLAITLPLSAPISSFLLSCPVYS
jgi:flagellin-like protein